MFDVKLEGIQLVSSASAYRELEDLALDLNDVKEIAVNGFDCAISKRKRGVLEKCLRRENRVIRVVLAKDYNNFLNREV